MFPILFSIERHEKTLRAKQSLQSKPPRHYKTIVIGYRALHQMLATNLNLYSKNSKKELNKDFHIFFLFFCIK